MNNKILFIDSNKNWILIEKKENGTINHSIITDGMVFSCIFIKSDIKTLERFFMSDDTNVYLRFKSTLESKRRGKKDIYIDKNYFKTDKPKKGKVYSVKVAPLQLRKIRRHFRGTLLTKYTIKSFEKDHIIKL